MFWIPEKLRSVGLKFSRQRRNLSFGLLFPGHMLSFWIKPGYLHYPLQPWAPEEGGRHCSLFESVEAPSLRQPEAMNQVPRCVA